MKNICNDYIRLSTIHTRDIVVGMATSVVRTHQPCTPWSFVVVVGCGGRTKENTQSFSSSLSGFFFFSVSFLSLCGCGEYSGCLGGSWLLTVEDLEALYDLGRGEHYGWPNIFRDCDCPPSNEIIYNFPLQ